MDSSVIIFTIKKVVDKIMFPTNYNNNSFNKKVLEVTEPFQSSILQNLK